MKRKIDRLSRQFIAAVSSSWFLKLTFAWFIIQAVYFAVTVRYGLPPDEDYHFTFITLFADHSPSPFLSDHSIPGVLIEVARNPFFLFHYLLSFPYLIFKHLPDSFIYLRLLNVAMSVGSLWFVYKIANLLKINVLARNLSIFMLANTLMFVFLAAGINYDNLMILLSLGAIYLFLKLWQRIAARDLLALITLLLMGSLTKVNYLPLAMALC